jgi:ATP-dependent exoDNAse (exonuclease V) beta subunit
MTIHKAKGLEFDAVILPELDKTWELRPGSVLIDRHDDRGHRTALAPVAAVTMYPNKAVRGACSELQELYEDRLDRAINEELCGLYVAMTRAKRYLEMIIDPNPKKSPYPSPAKVLCNAFVQGEQRMPGATLWKSPPRGEPWHFGIEPPVSSPDPSIVNVALADVETIPTAYLGRQSPSSLEGGSRLDLGELWKGDPGEGGRAATALDRGTAFHAMLECIEWLDDGLPSRKDLVEAIRRAGLVSVDAEQWAGELLASLSGRHASQPPASATRKRADNSPTLFDAITEEPSPLSAILRRSRYTGRPGTLRVRREWSFALRTSDADPHLLSGQFDRLVHGVQDSKSLWAEIIDFKTDAIPSSDDFALQSSINHYRPQLEAYKHAAARLLRLDPARVSATLVFIGPGRIVGV